MLRVDLNSDLGESYGSYKIGNDEGIIQYITSANVACGWHAGDPMVMERTVELAQRYDVGVGAHPGYYDLMGFGRRDMKLKPKEIKNYMKYQIGALMAFTKSRGMKLQHVKTHGALGNLSMMDETTARAICEAVYEIDSDLLMFGHAGSLLLKVAEETGLRTVSEVYGDRGYLDNGMLAPRNVKGAMIESVEEAVSRSLRMVKEGKVETISGMTIHIRADSLCVHGDTPRAFEFIKAITEAFQKEGIAIQNLMK
ncbi:5-oxoprolinase subunit PxpA [Anaerolentibacter hominis]|uniref:LamB/YcsF family protein n=1 Tax=Anaerolentibacter hominis TaxID=3079009 RepID=UPI0031B86C04